MQEKVGVDQYVADNIHTPGWFSANSDDLFDQLRIQTRNNENLDEVITSLLYIIPRVIETDELRRWGKLLEQVYNKTIFAQANGLDGEMTRDITSNYILRKRPAVPQLPTKTVRRKRLLLHPTQLFEIYLVFFVAEYYHMPKEITETMFEDLKRMAHLVRDTYCTNKLYQVLALLHNARYEFEIVKPYAHVSYGYFERLNNQLESGTCAHLLGSAYQNTGHLEEAQYWYMRSAEHLAETNNTRQYTTVALATSALKIIMEELDLAEQFADIGIREARKTHSRIHEATGWHLMAIIKATQGDIDMAYASAQDARNFYEEMGNETQLQHMEHTLALIEAREGKTAEALKRLQKMIRDLERVPESNSFREEGIRRAQDLIKKIQSGEVSPIH